MANMSYCRMENTYRDLCDCARAIEDINEGEGEKLSESESEYAQLLYAKCQEFIDEYDRMNEG